MNTKLTLSVEEDLIRKAKAIANERGKSVSQMVEDYFLSLLSDNIQKTHEEIPRP